MGQEAPTASARTIRLSKEKRKMLSLERPKTNKKKANSFFEVGLIVKLVMTIIIPSLIGVLMVMGFFYQQLFSGISSWYFLKLFQRKQYNIDTNQIALQNCCFTGRLSKNKYHLLTKSKSSIIVFMRTRLFLNLTSIR